MRLIEFSSSNSHDHGTIAMLKLNEEDSEKLYKWCNENNIPCIDKDKLHCTVLFSKKPVEQLSKHNNKDVNVEADIIGWKKLGDALTLELDAPIAAKIHEYMLKKGGTHDYPEYIAHISVCYDWSQQDLPAATPDFPITFDKLEVTGIDPDFNG